jgi:hypothetical protein
LQLLRLFAPSAAPPGGFFTPPRQRRLFRLKRVLWAGATTNSRLFRLDLLGVIKDLRMGSSANATACVKQGSFKLSKSHVVFFISLSHLKTTVKSAATFLTFYAFIGVVGRCSFTISNLAFARKNVAERISNKTKTLLSRQFKENQN